MNHRLRDTICKMSLKGLVAGRQAEKNMSQGKKHPFGMWAKTWTDVCLRRDLGTDRRVEDSAPSAIRDMRVKKQSEVTTPSKMPGLMES